MSNPDDMTPESATPEPSQKREFKGRDIFFPLVALVAGLIIGYIFWGRAPAPEPVVDNQQLEDQITQLQGEVATKSEQITLLESQISELEQELSNKSSEIEELNSEIARVEAELAESQMRITELESEFEIIQNQLTELENAVPPEVGELAKLKGELAAKSEQIDQLQSKITELEAELDLKNKRIAELESQLASEIAQLQTRISELESDLESKNNKIAELESQLATEIAQLQTRISKLESELEIKNNQITELEDELSTKFNQISLLELEVLAKDEQIADLKAQLEQASLSDPERIALLKEEIAQLKRESSDKSNEIARLNIQIRKLENKLAGEIPGISLPSFINLSGEEKYSFEVGEAIVSDEFKQYIIDEIVQQILSHKSDYGASIVEVIGHTDEQPIARGSTNFDNEILEAYKGSLPVDNLKPADNAGLGIARAVAVIKVLESIDELSGLTFVPLSGGQLILPSDGFIRGNLSGDVKERRRIEIRVRRSADPNYVGN